MALTPQPSKTKPHLAKMRDRARYGRIVRRARKARRGINPLGVGLPEQRRVYRRFIRALAQSTVPQAIAFVGLGDGFEVGELATCFARQSRLVVFLPALTEEQEAIERPVWDYIKAGECRAKISRVRPPWDRWIRAASGHLLLGRVCGVPGVTMQLWNYAHGLLTPLLTPATRFTLFRPAVEAPDGLYQALLAAGWRSALECHVGMMTPPGR